MASAKSVTEHTTVRPPDVTGVRNLNSPHFTELASLDAETRDHSIRTNQRGGSPLHVAKTESALAQVSPGAVTHGIRDILANVPAYASSFSRKVQTEVLTRLDIHERYAVGPLSKEVIGISVPLPHVPAFMIGTQYTVEVPVEIDTGKIGGTDKLPTKENLTAFRDRLVEGLNKVSKSDAKIILGSVAVTSDSEIFVATLSEKPAGFFGFVPASEVWKLHKITPLGEIKTIPYSGMDALRDGKTVMFKFPETSPASDGFAFTQGGIFTMGATAHQLTH